MSTHPAPVLLQMCQVRKAFAGVEVLRGVDFSVARGEIHALVGENGAGKSTLMKILGGVYQEYAGQIRLGGRTVHFARPRDAEQAGIAIIHQELALVPHLTVAENIFLGREPVSALGLVRQRAMEAAAHAVLRERLGLDLNVAQRVVDLPLGAQQMVEIAKALAREARLLVMDEPTSALTDADTQRLFAAIRQLRDRGVGIVYISHKMEEIYALADRITVLRDGQYIGTATPAELPRERLVQWMVGRTIEQFFPKQVRTPGRARLCVRGLGLRDRGTGRWLVHDVDLTVRAGEIVGVAGLIGSGNSELLGAIFGRYGPLERGGVQLDEQPVALASPRAAIRQGLALLTNDRKASGLVLPMSVLQNLSLSTLAKMKRRGLLSTARERERCGHYAERLRLSAPSLDAPVGTLSGGNQQKVVFARWLLTEPRVLLLDEPTRGIDVAAKADIYALLNELTGAGLGLLLITSELPELLALADRILVMHRGGITAELDRAEATQERVMHAALGA